MPRKGRIRTIVMDIYEKGLTRIFDSLLADTNLVRRIVFENKELVKDIVAIREKYKITWTETGVDEEENWFTRTDKETVNSLFQEIDSLEKKYCLPADICDALRGVVLDNEENTFPIHVLDDLPRKRTRYENNKEINEIVLTPDTDLDNKLILELIKLMQKAIREPIPELRVIEGNKHGKHDWRPIWEWEFRHPFITRKKLAKLMHRDYVDVKRKLEEFDKTYNTFSNEQIEKL